MKFSTPSTIGADVSGDEISLASEAAGDIMYFNGTDWVRLAKGTAGQAVLMNSGATAPEWSEAGHFSLVDSSEPTSDVSSVTFSSLSDKTYLLVAVINMTSTGGVLQLSFNGVETGTPYQSGGGSMRTTYSGFETTANHITDSVTHVDLIYRALISRTPGSSTTLFANIESMNHGNYKQAYGGRILSQSTISSIKLATSANNFEGNSCKFFLYEVKEA